MVNLNICRAVVWQTATQRSSRYGAERDPDVAAKRAQSPSRSMFGLGSRDPSPASDGPTAAVLEAMENPLWKIRPLTPSRNTAKDARQTVVRKRADIAASTQTLARPGAGDGFVFSLGVPGPVLPLENLEASGGSEGPATAATAF